MKISHTYHSAQPELCLKAPSFIWGYKVQVCSDSYTLTMICFSNIKSLFQEAMSEK